jgi:hypothetical protein
VTPPGIGPPHTRDGPGRPSPQPAESRQARHAHDDARASVAAGPVETEAQARALPAVRAIYEAARASSRRGAMGEGNHRLLCEALSAAGVDDLGSYDHCIVTWLANWEPQVVAVIAGWVTRARTAGQEVSDRPGVRR